jgi:hypothetical protein
LSDRADLRDLAVDDAPVRHLHCDRLTDHGLALLGGIEVDHHVELIRGGPEDRLGGGTAG